MKPHHVLRDAPAASRWWIDEAIKAIEGSDDAELLQVAKKTAPYAWGALRKIKGTEAKRGWLRFVLALQRIAAIRAVDGSSDWSTYGTVVEDDDPIGIYRPLVEALRREHPNESLSTFAKTLRDSVPSDDWKSVDRNLAILEEIGIPEAF